MTQGEWFTNHWRHHGTVHGDENAIPQWMGDSGCRNAVELRDWAALTCEQWRKRLACL